MGLCKLQAAADSFEKATAADFQEMKRCRIEKPPHLSHKPLNNGTDSYGYIIPVSLNRYCTLESSSLLFNQEPTVGPTTEPSHSTSPCFSGSCVTEEEATDLKIKLKELETAMLGPDPEDRDDDDTFSGPAADVESWRKMMEAAPGGDLTQLLTTCAKAVSSGDSIMARWLMSELRRLVSVYGEPVQRLGAYVLEGLVAKLTASGSSICRSLETREPAGLELLSYMHVLYEACPYFKFGYMSANGAIAEAMKDEARVHIIDFQVGQGSQWVPLIQAFAGRPGGPPRIRITGLDGPGSARAGRRLSKLAKIFKVPLEFASAGRLGDIDARPGEALAVNFAFALHRVPDEGVGPVNHRDGVLRAVKGLNPKVVTLVEQELNTNTSPFYPRFLEVVDYYGAMFESIDATLPRGCKERINVEQQCLARDVVNVIACEGKERVERHEPLGKWRSRFEMAGFRPYPLSPVVNGAIEALLRGYCGEYRLEEREGALFLGWLERDLVASSAWK